MALADTVNSIEKVSEWIRSSVHTITQVDTFVGRPEPKENTNPRLNLFLYEAHLDPHLKNYPLDNGQAPPLWLVLKYLLTAFDGDGKSSTPKAHANLGIGLSALQQLAFLPESAFAALQPNPEILKITFEETNSELLSKLMQGPDDKFHFSMGFQVRPVMITTGELPSYSLLVGVDYDSTPPDVIGQPLVNIDVFPSMGPQINEIEPASFEANQSLLIKGSNLDESDLLLRIGTEDLPVSDQQAESLRCTVAGNIPDGEAISARSHPVSLFKELGGGRTRSSNMLIGQLRPTLDTATPSGLVDVAGKVTGKIDLGGLLLGTAQDDVFLALYQDGATVKIFDTSFTFALNQKTLSLDISSDDAVDPGDYLVILRVNGQQALKSINVSLVP